MKRVAIIGAGSSELPAIKTCLEENLEPVCYERDVDIGGLWRYKDKAEFGVSSVMKSTVINVSKEMMSYSDFPAPKEFPMFMPHRKVLEYYKLYAKEFGLLKYIHFQTEVLKVRQAADFSSSGRWEVEVKDHKTQESRKEIFDAVMLCTGHHSEKHLPHFEGMEEFEGRMIHSHDYRDTEGFHGKRVVVVGLGNSGGDIAVELAKFGCQVYLSTRRGSWMVPRVLPGGEPFDDALNNRFLSEVAKICPTKLFTWYLETYFNKLTNLDMLGLKPKNSINAQHILINDELANRIESGTVILKPNIERLTKRNVNFVDGSVVEDIDVVVFATGYKFGFRFMEHECLEVKDNEIKLYNRVFPPDIHPPTLAVIGCFQPLGPFMPASELQGRWAVRILKAELSLPSVEEMHSDIRRKAEESSHRYVHSLRHTMQIDYIPYVDNLMKLCGCDFSWMDLLMRDPALMLKMYFGPVTPYQFRLVGHGSWSGARDAIMTSHDRLLYPLNNGRNRRKSGKSTMITAEKVLLIAFIFLGIIIKFIF